MKKKDQILTKSKQKSEQLVKIYGSTGNLKKNNIKFNYIEQKKE